MHGGRWQQRTGTASPRAKEAIMRPKFRIVNRAYHLDVFKGRRYIASTYAYETAEAIIDVEIRRDNNRGRERELQRLRSAIRHQDGEQS